MALDDQPAVPGDPNKKKKEGNTLITVLVVIGVILLLALCLMPVVVIVILALLGPSIGNVFSNIVTELDGFIPLLPLLFG